MSKTGEPHVDDLTFFSLLSVLQGGMWLLNDIEDFLRKYAISHGRFSILLAVMEAGTKPVKPVDLSNIIGKSKPTLSKMLKKLVEDRLITLSSCREDARALNIRLTKKAEELLKGIIPGYNARILEMAAGLTADDKIQLMRIISRINFLNPGRKIVVKT